MKGENIAATIFIIYILGIGVSFGYLANNIHPPKDDMNFAALMTSFIWPISVPAVLSYQYFEPPTKE